MKTRPLLLTLLAGASIATSHAQAPNTRSSGAEDAGSAIARQGSNGAAPCMSCHGAQGEGNPAGGFPRLAAQSAPYLARQLELYASGARKNPIMEPIAKALSDQQRTAVAEHYAGLDAPRAAMTPSAAPDPSVQARGRTLADIGDAKLRVQACGNCHGPDGRGEPPVYPYLAGQVEAYLVATLSAWKQGGRATDPSGQMNAIARALSDADIAAVGNYFTRQNPPPASFAHLAPPPADAAASAAPVPRTPANTASGGAQGVGSEQGAPTTGGGQGPGGGGAASGAGSVGSPDGSPPASGTAVPPANGAPSR